MEDKVSDLHDKSEGSLDARTKGQDDRKVECNGCAFHREQVAPRPSCHSDTPSVTQRQPHDMTLGDKLQLTSSNEDLKQGLHFPL